MAVPKRRTSKSHKRKRRSHQALQAPNIPKSQKVRAAVGRSTKFFCSNCNQPKLPHAVCPNCGFYRGKSLIEVER
ncbi:MAG: 50S ribosomal protein L32 [Planctomycetes bacterium]|nr:50S ribosomal protein L32 [Planctomycetota bacterium]